MNQTSIRMAIMNVDINFASAVQSPGYPSDMIQYKCQTPYDMCYWLSRNDPFILIAPMPYRKEAFRPIPRISYQNESGTEQSTTRNTACAVAVMVGGSAVLWGGIAVVARLFLF